MQATNKYFPSDSLKNISKPDSFSHNSNRDIKSDFVLCRDKKGKPTAIYGKNVWDFTPYSLDPSEGTVTFKFNDLPSELASECKYLMFILIHYVETGYLNSLSVGSLKNYYIVLKNAASYCLFLSRYSRTGEVTLSNLFSVPAYLSSFVESIKSTGLIKKLQGILSHFLQLGPEILGFTVVSKGDIEINIEESLQHPVIPQRIYLGYINNLLKDIENAHLHLNKIKLFLSEFKDPEYGYSNSTQKKRGIWPRRPTTKEALDTFGLKEYFGVELKITSKRHIQRGLAQIQWTCKQALHLFTGMRNAEVNRTKLGCLKQEKTSKKRHSLLDGTKEPFRIINVISTTTKFHGHEVQAKWLAPDIVVTVVEVLEGITRAICEIQGFDVEGQYLLMNASAFSGEHGNRKVSSFKPKHQPTWVKEMLITANDFQELCATDVSRNFACEEKFAVGQPWPITTHQYRRSLAFYGSNSGFLSLPTLKTQYKQLSMAMAQYYTNNFENITTIFGRYNPKTKKIEIPKDHFLYDFQTARPSNITDQLLADILSSASPLQGKTGSYIEKQKERLDGDTINFDEVREETEKKVAKGELSYKKTLLGGCLKNDRCDSYLLGDLTACLDCPDAMIKSEKVDKEIQILESEIRGYNESENRGELQIAQNDLDKLISFRDRKKAREKEIDVEVEYE